ncbi:hypothetical protein T440DRAFT_523193 [Plenodomus tracheiphilus IPT5]|uniref:Glutamine amidotransferase type-2 domain-containing protein n=1 Tax=Plenodomus tracheiphilus IPT5 TaxID=1408161 RepID=A0A6A7ANI3_9PLEO|nr:hypothetical protein T440DRAFT_523193 [Plenodomus tracheiphilus IPT5]
MCGIFCSLSCHGFVSPDPNTTQLLVNRGPDSTGQLEKTIETRCSSHVHATFLSTVLALRGSAIVQQPLTDAATGSVLCWNGEAWSIAGEAVPGNDSELVFERLVKACAVSAEESAAAAVALLSSIRGPYALVFYDACHKRVYFGRDCLGRRSLLRKKTADGTLVFSSVCDNFSSDAWSEVEADGLYYVDLELVDETKSFFAPTHVPHRRLDQRNGDALSFPLRFPLMNREISSSAPALGTETVSLLKNSLQKSLALRVQHVREAVVLDLHGQRSDAQVAILFSGGLDCTILARICHDLLPLTDTIDLLNVAFENPRIHAKLEDGASPYELCPDRITGRASHAELVNICPDRLWRFVEVNVPYTETQSHRSTVMALMHPHNTEMDLSISFALYFASRGVGVTRVMPLDPPEPYSSTAHVLLSGLGADELFGGYQRHATAFARYGYPGLIEELELDFDRLGKRNLGRDDRIISNSSKEVRFPFLDEDFIALALRLPVPAKCDFGRPQVEISENHSKMLEPAKRALRLLAWDLGMQKVAKEKKRAIQFGARTAKMETGKTKGTHVLT